MERRCCRCGIVLDSSVEWVSLTGYHHGEVFCGATTCALYLCYDPCWKIVRDVLREAVGAGLGSAIAQESNRRSAKGRQGILITDKE